MSDKAQKLVRMANQVADFFAPYSAAEAAAGVREHIVSFWTLAMRRDLDAHVAASGTRELRPAVVAALAELAAKGSAPAADSPAERASAEPRELGQAASDAG